MNFPPVAHLRRRCLRRAPRALLAGSLIAVSVFAAALVRSSPRTPPDRQVSFLTNRQAASGVQSRSLDAADFNRDGYDDLAVLDGSLVVVLLSDGRGNFSPPLWHRAGGILAKQLVARDFNHDRNPDVAVAYADGTVWIFLGDGQGGLSTGQKVTVGGTLTSLAPLDFDADGHLDLVVALAGGSVTGRAQLLRNDGQASFTLTGPAVPIGRAPRRITAGDFDGDGHADVAAANEFDRTVTVLFGDGAGGVANPLTLSTVQPASGGAATTLMIANPLPAAVTAGDLNGDGLDDLVVANDLFNLVGVTPPGIFQPASGGAADREPPMSPGFGNVAVFMSAGGRSFAAPIFLNADNFPHDVRIVDADGDARPDIVAGSAGVLLFLARGDGTYARTGTPLSEGVGQAVTAGDFNCDGRVDFALAGISPRVDIYLGLGGGQLPSTSFIHTTAAPVPNSDYQSYLPVQSAAADLNNDGIMDLVTAAGQTLVSFLGTGGGDFAPALASEVGRATSWFALADFTGDGYTDVALNDNENHHYPIDLFVGDGRGHFSPGPRISEDADYGKVAVADFDEDGRPDLVAEALRYEPDSPGVDVFVNAGDGRFQRTARLSTKKGTVDVMVADLDRDGHADLLLINGSDPLSVFLGKGDGTFHDEIVFPLMARGGVQSAALADFDDDGFPDLVLSQVSAGSFWMHGDGHGHFSNPVHLAPEYLSIDAGLNFMGQVVAQDFDGDGHVDIAIAYFNGVTVFRNNGRGGFPPASSFFFMALGGEGVPLTAADLNGDGLIDLTTPAEGPTEDGRPTIRFNLLYNTTAPATVITGDANCDRVVSGADLSALVRRLFCSHGLPACTGADANEDAAITAPDLTGVIKRLPM